jgi:hypothetical protein
VFTARYGLTPYIKRLRLVFKSQYGKTPVEECWSAIECITQSYQKQNTTWNVNSGQGSDRPGPPRYQVEFVNSMTSVY